MTASRSCSGATAARWTKPNTDALRVKLQEEVAESLESGDVLELADILEVVYALAKLDGVSSAELEQRRAAKAEERGSFERRLWWEPE